MKKSILAAIALTAGLLCGCSDNTRLSPSAIAKQAQAELENEALSILYTKFQLGTYECNDADTQLKLARMKAAKLIDYTVTRYAWWEKSRRWYSVSYDFRDHYVYTVSLTSKGERLVLDEAPAPVEEPDKDLEFDEFDAADYSWGKKDVSESWPVIPNPFQDQARGDDDPVCDGYYGDDDSNAGNGRKAPKAVPQGVVLSDTLAFQSYHAAPRDNEAQIVLLRLGRNKVAKVRNIRFDGTLSNATAEAIIAVTEATDAGRIIAGIENGQKDVVKVNLTYYVDKGWVVSDLDE